MIKKNYKIVPKSETPGPFYTIFEVEDGNQKKKSLVFFNAEIEKYNILQDLLYNVSVFHLANHPHLLRMDDYIEYEQGQQHIFEHFGQDLQTYVHHMKKKLTEQEIFEILEDILCGIDGVISRKYFPQNLRPQHFVLAEGKWKIRCVVFQDNNHNANGLNSEYSWNPIYIPPQLYDSVPLEAVYSSEIVWGIGCIVLFLVQRRHKLYSLQAIRDTYSKGFKSLGPKLSELLQKSLHPNPKQRASLGALRQFLKPKVGIAPLNSLSSAVEDLEENLRVSKQNKLKSSTAYFLRSSLNESLDLFKTRAINQMSRQMLDSKALHISFTKSSYLHFEPIPQENGNRHPQIKQSWLPTNSIHNLEGQNKPHRGFDILAEFQFQKQPIPKMQHKVKDQQVYASPNTKADPPKPVSKLKPLKIYDEAEAKEKKLYTLLDNIKEVKTRQSVQGWLNVFRQEREKREYLYRLCQDIRCEQYSQEGLRLRVKLLECGFILAAISYMNPIVLDLKKGQTRFLLEDFSTFKKSQLFRHVRQIFQLKQQQYLKAFRSKLQDLRACFNIQKLTQLPFYGVLKSCHPQQMDYSDLKKNVEYTRYVNQIYIYNKERYQTTKQKSYLAMAIKLIICVVIDVVFLPKNRDIVFRQFIEWSQLENPQNLFLTDYINFLDKCDQQVLKKHKEDIKSLKQ